MIVFFGYIVDIFFADRFLSLDFCGCADPVSKSIVGITCCHLRCFQCGKPVSHIKSKLSYRISIDSFLCHVSSLVVEKLRSYPAGAGTDQLVQRIILILCIFPANCGCSTVSKSVISIFFCCLAIFQYLDQLTCRIIMIGKLFFFFSFFFEFCSAAGPVISTGNLFVQLTVSSAADLCKISLKVVPVGSRKSTWIFQVFDSSIRIV